MNSLGLLWCVLAVAYGMVAWLSIRFRRTEKLNRPVGTPPVTILKPLCGAEPHLYECLKSLCEQRYPIFQITFGVSDATDPAVGVVRRLQREFANIEMTLVVDGRQRGSNRKVSNLINMMPHARHDYLLVADSDIRVPPDYLTQIVAPLQDPEVGIVTCPYLGAPQPGLWSQLGALFINGWFMPSVRVAAWFGSRAFAFGATIALRRETLTAIGGFAAVADQLADDYRLGELTRQLGLRTVLSEIVVETRVHEPSLSALVRHELRWLRTICTVRPVGYALAFVSFSVPMAALGAMMDFGSDVAATLLVLAVLLRGMLHFAMRTGRSSVGQSLMVVLNDFLLFALWAWAPFASRVQWRDVSYEVTRDGAVRPVTEAVPEVPLQ